MATTIDVYHVCFFPEIDSIRILKLDKKQRMKVMLNHVQFFKDKEENAVCYGVQVLGRSMSEAEDLANLLIGIHMDIEEEEMEDPDYLPQRRRDC